MYEVSQNYHEFCALFTVLKDPNFADRHDRQKDGQMDKQMISTCSHHLLSPFYVYI